MTRRQRRVGGVFGVLGWIAVVGTLVAGLLGSPGAALYLLGGAAVGAFTTAIVSGRDSRLA